MLTVTQARNVVFGDDWWKDMTQLSTIMKDMKSPCNRDILPVL